MFKTFIMSVQSVVLLGLLAYAMGMSVSQPLAEKDITQAEQPSSSVLKMGRCLGGESVQPIRRSVLQGLNLQQEPQAVGSRVGELREQWKALYQASSSYAQQLNTDHGATGDALQPEGAAREVQCCKLSKQVFLTDLGWENWVIYPESFTFTQCSGCSLSSSSGLLCPNPDTAEPSPQVPCCQAVAHDSVPFLYVDGTGGLVMSPVLMPRQCGCRQDAADSPDQQA